MPRDARRMMDAFYDDMAAAFDAQARRLGETSFDLALAGHELRLRFAGEELSHLFKPLSHLAVEGDSTKCDASTLEEESPFEILIFNGVAPGAKSIRPPWTAETNPTTKNDRWRREHGDVLVSHVPSIDFLQLLHRGKRQAIYWINQAQQLSFWEIAAPLRTIFRWWAADNGLQLAHAAVVGRNGRGVLLTGRSGQGKSTTAAACLAAGMEFVSDDYVLLSTEPNPTAHCLFNSAKLHTQVLNDHFPGWRENVVRHIGPEQKSLFFVHRSWTNQLRSSLNVAAIVCPQISGGADSRIVPASRGETLRSMGPSTVLPHASQQGHDFSFLANLIRRSPTFRLELGPIASSPAALDGLLRQETTHVV